MMSLGIDCQRIKTWCGSVLFNIDDRMNFQIGELAPDPSGLLKEFFVTAFDERKRDMRTRVDPGFVKVDAGDPIGSSLFEKLDRFVMAAGLEPKLNDVFHVVERS